MVDLLIWFDVFILFLECCDFSVWELIWVMCRIMQGGVSEVQFVGFFVVFCVKGEMIDEIVGFCDVIFEVVVFFFVLFDVFDIVGIGGDCVGIVNVLMIVVIIIGVIGVFVVKYGNCVVSLVFGFLDVFGVFGFEFLFDFVFVVLIFDWIGIMFVWVGVFYFGFKYVGFVWVEFGVLMVFNMFGLLCNLV